MKNFSAQRGFTLVELLVVIAVMSVIGTISTDLFSSVIRGGNKANVINEVKQNGQQALDVMERYIRNAATVSGPSTTELDLNVADQPVIFKCTGGKITMQVGTAPVRDLTNTNSQSGVKVRECAFTVTLAGTAPGVVKIDLTLDQAAADSSRQEFKADVKLSTTVSLRTY